MSGGATPRCTCQAGRNIDGSERDVCPFCEAQADDDRFGNRDMLNELHGVNAFDTLTAENAALKAEVEAQTAALDRLTASSEELLMAHRDLRALNAELVAALQDVANPLGRLAREAEKRGAQLSGMAYEIANSIAYIQSIAREALAKAEAAK